LTFYGKRKAQATRKAGGFGWRPSKKRFFDGITALCLSPSGFPGGKEHKETALNGRFAPPDEPAQPENRVKGCGP